MESCDGPKHSHVTVGRPSVQRVPVIQPQRDTVGFGGRIRPFQNLFGPVHSQVRRDLSGRDEFVLAGVPKIVVRFAVFELRFAVGRNPGIRRMRGKARQSPGGRSIERVVRIFLMKAEILRQFAADEVFFRKRFPVLVGGGRGIHCQYRFFGRQISVAEMGGKSGRGAGIGVIAPVGVSGKPEFDEVCQKFASFGLPSPESGNRSDRTVAIRGFEFFGDGSGDRSSVTYGQIRQFRARDPFRKNELLPKFGTQRPRSDLEFVAHGPRRNGTPGIDFENGNARRFANRFSERQLGANGREIENDRGKSPSSQMFANPFPCVVTEKRKKRNREFLEPFRHFRERIRFRGKVAEVAVRP